MNESLSAQIRIGIAIMMTAQLVIVVANCMIIAMQYMSNFNARFISSMQATVTSVDYSIVTEDRLDAPTVYKFIAERESRLKAVSIKFLDGVVTADYTVLLRNACMKMKMDVTEDLSGKLTIAVEEVE